MRDRIDRLLKGDSVTPREQPSQRLRATLTAKSKAREISPERKVGAGIFNFSLNGASPSFITFIPYPPFIAFVIP